MNDYFETLPDVEFVNENTEETEKRIVGNYETYANRKLFPADPIRIVLKAIALEFSQARVLINITGKQNLLRYAREGHLENIAVLPGTERLEPKKAITKLKFTLSAAQAFDVTVPKGTRATAGDGVNFETLYDSIIKQGLTVSDEIDAECTVAGVIGNDYLVGQINQIVDMFLYAAAVTNTIDSDNGADLEDLESFRDRTRIAPEEYSTAGPYEGYKSLTYKVHQNIKDVYVHTPTAGTVNIVPLMVNGELPTTEMLTAIDTALSDNYARPLTDHVTVTAPVVVNYNIDFTYYISKANEVYKDDIALSITKAVDEFVLWQKEKLGRAINPDELILKLRQAGAYRVVITSPVYTEIALNEVAVAGTINIVYGGVVNNV